MNNDNGKKIEAVIFDFDGVLANTDLYHFIAWKKAVRQLGINMDPSIQKDIKGLTRQGTLNKILKIFNIENISEEQFKSVMDKKNEIYMELIQKVTKEDVLPGIVTILKWLKKNEYKLGVASVSKNAKTIINNIGLSKYFDVIIDPDEISLMKPAPDIFFATAKALNVKPWNCIGIEDSQVGIEAINSSFMQSICIDFHNELNNCSLKFSSTKEMTPEKLNEFINSIE